jgi:hypothetical protein
MADHERGGGRRVHVEMLGDAEHSNVDNYSVTTIVSR